MYNPRTSFSIAQLVSETKVREGSEVAKMARKNGARTTKDLGLGELSRPVGADR